MARENDRGRGRPRGSGLTARVAAIELTAREATPFYAGVRIMTQLDPILATRQPALADITPHLLPGERAGLRDSTDEHFLCWVLIGCMYRHLCLAIERERSL